MVNLDYRTDTDMILNEHCYSVCWMCQQLLVNTYEISTLPIRSWRVNVGFTDCCAAPKWPKKFIAFIAKFMHLKHHHYQESLRQQLIIWLINAYLSPLHFGIIKSVQSQVEHVIMFTKQWGLNSVSKCHFKFDHAIDV